MKMNGCFAAHVPLHLYILLLFRRFWESIPLFVRKAFGLFMRYGVLFVFEPRCYAVCMTVHCQPIACPNYKYHVNAG